MSGKVLASRRLKNGLSMLCIDHSRRIAADRWYICIRVRIDIDVDRKWFTAIPVDDLKFQDIRHVLGENVVFEQNNERNFVSDELKEGIVADICSRALATGDRYYSHANFAPRYILKRYSDRMKRRY